MAQFLNKPRIDPRSHIWQFGSETDIGGGRENQDDRFIWDNGQVCVAGVLDGHGREVGKLAAVAAKEALLRFFSQNFTQLFSDPVHCLTQAHNIAHDHIRETFKQEYQRQGYTIEVERGYLLKRKSSGQGWTCIHGGTSCSLLAIVGDILYIANVGDSSALLSSSFPILDQSLLEHLSDAATDSYPNHRALCQYAENKNELLVPSSIHCSSSVQARALSDTLVITAEHSPESPSEFLRLRTHRCSDTDPSQPALLVVYDSPSVEKPLCPPVFRLDHSFDEELVAMNLLPRMKDVPVQGGNTPLVDGHQGGVMQMDDSEGSLGPALSLPHSFFPGGSSTAMSSLTPRSPNPNSPYSFPHYRSSSSSSSSVPRGIPILTNKGKYYKNVRKEWASLVSTPPQARFQDALAFTRSLGDLHLHSYGVTHLPEIQRIDLRRVWERVDQAILNQRLSEGQREGQGKGQGQGIHNVSVLERKQVTETDGGEMEVEGSSPSSPSSSSSSTSSSPPPPISRTVLAPPSMSYVSSLSQMTPLSNPSLGPSSSTSPSPSPSSVDTSTVSSLPMPSSLPPGLGQYLCLTLCSDGVWDNWVYSDVTRFMMDGSCLNAVHSTFPPLAPYTPYSPYSSPNQSGTFIDLNSTQQQQQQLQQQQQSSSPSSSSSSLPGEGEGEGVVGEGGGSMRVARSFMQRNALFSRKNFGSQADNATGVVIYLRRRQEGYSIITSPTSSLAMNLSANLTLETTHS